MASTCRHCLFRKLLSSTELRWLQEVTKLWNKIVLLCSLRTHFFICTYGLEVSENRKTHNEEHFTLLRGRVFHFLPFPFFIPGGDGMSGSLRSFYSEARLHVNSYEKPLLSGAPFCHVFSQALPTHSFPNSSCRQIWTVTMFKALFSSPLFLMLSLSAHRQDIWWPGHLQENSLICQLGAWYPRKEDSCFGLIRKCQPSQEF